MIIESVNDLRIVANALLETAKSSDAYYFDSLFSDLPLTKDKFLEYVEKYDDATIRDTIDKINEILRAKLIESALNGKVPPSTAQFVLQNIFGIGDDKAQTEQNVTIIYTDLTDEDRIEGEDGE